MFSEYISLHYNLDYENLVKFIILNEINSISFIFIIFLYTKLAQVLKIKECINS